jgi:hypothetical protein
MRRHRVLVVACVLVAAMVGREAAGHGGKRHSTRGRPPPPTAEEKAAFEAARPALERHCLRCHSRSGEKATAKALKHIDMGTYPFGGHHPRDAGKAIRISLVGDERKGKKPTMPTDHPGSVTGEDLHKILAWAEAFEKARANEKAGRHGSETKHSHAR